MVMENKEDVLRQDDDLSFLICKGGDVYEKRLCLAKKELTI